MVQALLQYAEVLHVQKLCNGHDPEHLLQVWQEKVYPLLKDHLAGEMDSLGAYMLLYHAAVLANLLEVGVKK